MLRVHNEEDVDAVENIYRREVTSDSEYTMNCARQLQLMMTAYRAGKQAQFQADIKGFIELLLSSEYEIGLKGQGNFYAVPERELKSLKQLVEGKR